MFNDNRYFAPLAKIYDDRTLILQKYGQREFVNYGIYVDIFIIDNIPDDSSEAERLYKKAERIRKYWGYSIKEFNAPSSSRMKKIARIPVIICHRLVGYKHYLKQYDKIARSTTNSSRKGVIIYGEGVNKESFDSKMFESTSIVTFEGEHFKAPCCPDLYLHQMYGDYLKLPPENERKYHPSVAYWK
jgi:lipopolysaccharide cholinephosphotransferase